MKAIITKFHGCTETRGARYSASDSDGNRVYVEAGDYRSADQNHEAAMRALCAKMAWYGRIVSGGLADSQQVWVWLPDSAEIYTITKEGEPFFDGLANARLIAAAPDLLEALKEALSAYGRTVAQAQDDVPLEQWEIQARAAIAKASP